MHASWYSDEEYPLLKEDPQYCPPREYVRRTHTRVCVCVAGLGQIEKNITKIKWEAMVRARRPGKTEKTKAMAGGMLKIEPTARGQLVAELNDEWDTADQKFGFAPLIPDSLQQASTGKNCYGYIFYE